MAEDVVSMHGSCDFTEVMKGLSGVDGDQVSGDAIPDAVAHRLERGPGCSQGFEVAQVGNDELVAAVVGAVPLKKGLTQVVESGAC